MREGRLISILRLEAHCKVATHKFSFNLFFFSFQLGKIYNHMNLELSRCKFLNSAFVDEKTKVENCLAIAYTLFADVIKMLFVQDEIPYCSLEE